MVMLANLDIADYETLCSLMDQADETGISWGLGTSWSPARYYIGTLVDLSVERNRAVLLAMHRDGMIELSRADLSPAHDPDLIASSTMEVDGATYHLIRFLMA